MLEIIDNNKPIEEKYGNNYWMFSLRRPKYLDFIRIIFLYALLDGVNIIKFFVIINMR